MTVRSGKSALQGLHGQGAGALVVEGNDHRAVGEAEEVHVRGRQGVVLLVPDPSQGEGMRDLEGGRAVGVGKAGEGRAPRRRRRRRSGHRGRRPGAGDHAWRYEPGEVVDVTVGVVVHQSLRQPQHLARAEGPWPGPGLGVGLLRASRGCGWG